MASDLRDPRRKVQFSYMCLRFPNDGMFEGSVSFSRGVRVSRNATGADNNDSEDGPATRRISVATYFSQNICVKGSWEMLYMAFESLSSTQQESTAPCAVAHFRIHANVYLIDGSQDVFAGQGILWLDSGTLVLFSPVNGHVCHCAPASVAGWFKGGGVLETNSLFQAATSTHSSTALRRGKHRAVHANGINFEASRRNSHPATFGTGCNSTGRGALGNGAPKREVASGNFSDDEEYENVTHIHVSSRPASFNKISGNARPNVLNPPATESSQPTHEPQPLDRTADEKLSHSATPGRLLQRTQSTQLVTSPIQTRRRAQTTTARTLHAAPQRRSRRASRCAGLTLAYASHQDRTQVGAWQDAGTSHVSAQRTDHVSAGTGSGQGILAAHNSPEYSALREELWASPDTLSRRAIYGSARWLSIIECDVKRMGLGALVNGNMAADQDELAECDTEADVSEVPPLLIPAGQNRSCTKRVFRKMAKFVLRSIAFAYPDIGYCQGMHCIARHLLFNALWMQQQRGHLDARAAAESALVSLSLLIQDDHYQLRRLFSPGLALLRELCTEVEARLAWLDPALAQHLKTHDMHSDMYATKWIITIFTVFELGPHDGPLVQTAFLRFMSEGWNAILNLAVAVVIYNKDTLMTSDLEGCFSVLLCTNLQAAGESGNPLVPLFTTEKGLAAMEIVKVELAKYPSRDKYQRPQVLALPELKTLRRSQSAAGMVSSADDLCSLAERDERKRAVTIESFSKASSFRDTGGGDGKRRPSFTSRNSYRSVCSSRDMLRATERDARGGQQEHTLDGNAGGVVDGDKSQRARDWAYKRKPRVSSGLGLSASILSGSGFPSSMQLLDSKVGSGGVDDGDGEVSTALPTPPELPPKQAPTSPSRSLMSATGDRWNTWLARRVDGNGTFARHLKVSTTSAAGKDMNTGASLAVECNGNRNGKGGNTAGDSNVVPHPNPNPNSNPNSNPNPGNRVGKGTGGLKDNVGDSNMVPHRRKQSKRMSMNAGAAVVPMALAGVTTTEAGGLPPKPPKPAKLLQSSKKQQKRWWNTFA